MRFLSVCSGIEAASAAWHPLGWRAHAFAEIEAFPSAVLAHHYPDVPNWGDMTKFQEWPDAAIDVLVGGTPCQSFSVAGLRKGMADPRGNLALVYLGIADRYRPRWVVWENVPGVLSSNGGRDFGAFLGGLAELGYGFAYRILDAQFFGLAQRRKRVFVVGHLGDWRRAAAVLFEPASLRGDSPPRRPEGKGFAADVVASLVSSGCGIERTGETRGQDPVIAEFVSGTLQTTTHDWSRNEPGEGLIAHALRAEGFDASEDGTGRGTPLVPICFDETQITSAENRCRPEPGDPSHPLARGARPPTIAFSAKDYGADAMNNLSPCLRAGGHNESHANAGVMPAIAFHARQDPDSGPVTHPLDTDGTSIGIMHHWRVRRLTPRECERLQGFPDDYTAIPYPKPKWAPKWPERVKYAADGPRYKALGNSMAVPVMRWIGERIAAIDEIENVRAA
jgi:DNA (cytosine-5)-methyltransferase 1